MRRLLSIRDAQAAILERAQPLGSERVPLAAAGGRVVAEDARAAVDLPPFPSSAMDGFAVRSLDVPATLPVVGAIPAGGPAVRPLEAGQAVAIATGGALPDGADAVVPLEYVVNYDDKIEVPDSLEAGANVRPRGGDARAGDVVAAAGERLSPQMLGALAAAGVAEVVCARRPRAAVLATGSELREPGQPLGPAQIYEANTVMLATALAAAGADPERLPLVPDDADTHRAALARGLEADVLVTSGGVSVGPHDLVRATGTELGVAEVFWGVAVRPGKPLAFGVRGRTLVFGLPGNPVYVLVAFHLFVRPAVLALQGADAPLPPFLPARLARPLRRNRERDELVRARSSVSGEGVEVDPVVGQESHMIVRSAAADALVFLPAGEGELPAGAAVRYLPLD